MSVFRADVIARMKWRVRSLAEQLDHLDILIVTLAGLLLGLGMTVLWPLQERMNRLEADIVTLSHPAQDSAKPAVSSSKSPAPVNQTQAFIHFLPSASRQTELLRQLHELAPAQGLKTGTVRYNPLSMTHLPVEGLLIHLEWQGDDRALQAARRNVLQRFPSLAIRSLTLSRNRDTGLGSLSLELTLYMRREVPDAP